MNLGGLGFPADYNNTQTAWVLFGSGFARASLKRPMGPFDAVWASAGLGHPLHRGLQRRGPAAEPRRKVGCGHRCGRGGRRPTVEREAFERLSCSVTPFFFFAFGGVAAPLKMVFPKKGFPFFFQGHWRRRGFRSTRPAKELYTVCA